MKTMNMSTKSARRYHEDFHDEAPLWDMSTTLKDIVEVVLDDEFFEDAENVMNLVMNDRELLNKILREFDSIAISRDVLKEIRRAVSHKATVLYARKSEYDLNALEDECMTFADFKKALLGKGKDNALVVASDRGYTYCSLDRSNFFMDGNFCCIDVTHDAYSIADCASDETVEELLDNLDIGDDALMVFSNDDGYTYGACNNDIIRVKNFIPESN